MTADIACAMPLAGPIHTRRASRFRGASGRSRDRIVLASRHGPNEVETLLADYPRLLSKLKPSIIVHVRHDSQGPPHDQCVGFGRRFSYRKFVWRCPGVAAVETLPSTGYLFWALTAALSKISDTLQSRTCPCFLVSLGRERVHVGADVDPIMIVAQRHDRP